MNNNPYVRNYPPYILNQQNIGEQIDYQINQLQQMKEQMKNNNQQPAINQTFQLAPSNNTAMKYANTIEDVSRENVFCDTPFFSKDLSVMWLKNTKGEIKSYELNEIVLKDDKDIMIDNLQAQINELKGMIKDESNGNIDEPIESTKSTNVPVHTTSSKAKKQSY